MKIYYENFIYQLLQEKKRISYKELSNICNISLPTVRKYTTKLKEKKLLTFIYGGIELISEKTQKLTEKFQDYQSIAQYAVTLIKDNEVIFLGPGKTVATICDYLDRFKNLTVFTNSIYVIEKLSHLSNITLIVIGGFVQRTNMSLSLYNNNCPSIHISKLFIGCSGIDLERGIFHNLPIYKTIEEVLIDRSKEVILLADKSKFDLEQAFILMSIDEINLIITNHDLNKKYIDQLNNKKISFILSNKYISK